MRVKLFTFIVAFVLLGVFVNGWTWFAGLKPDSLRNGDLVFQTSTSEQSNAIMVATQSVYSHMGIIKRAGNTLKVVEAVGPVKETPLDQWIQQGVLARMTIMRDQRLSPEQAKRILSRAKQYYGQPYDLIFRFNNDRVYCSELAYLAYQAIGLPIGHVQTISDLQVRNPLLERLMRSHWKLDPACKEFKSFEACKPKVLSQTLITPASIFKDKHLAVIYSNYPPIITGLWSALKL